METSPLVSGLCAAIEDYLSGLVAREVAKILREQFPMPAPESSAASASPAPATPAPERTTPARNPVAAPPPEPGVALSLEDLRARCMELQGAGLFHDVVRELRELGVTRLDALPEAQWPAFAWALDALKEGAAHA